MFTRHIHVRWTFERFTAFLLCVVGIEMSEIRLQRAGAVAAAPI
jgi:hypothetical protein